MFDEEMRQKFVVATKAFAAEAVAELRVRPLADERRRTRIRRQDRVDRVRRGEAFVQLVEDQRIDDERKRRALDRRTLLQRRRRSTAFRRFPPFGQFFADVLARLGHQNQRVFALRRRRVDLKKRSGVGIDRSSSAVVTVGSMYGEDKVGSLVAIELLVFIFVVVANEMTEKREERRTFVRWDH